MAARKAEVIFVGDAESVVKAARQAAGATGKASKEISSHTKEVEGGFHRIREGAKGLAEIAGVSALAFGLKDVTEEAVKAQSEQFKLKNTVKDAGISWKAHGSAVDEWLDKTSRASGFAKSELSASLGNMVRSTGNLTKARKLDGMAMDIARSKGIGLANAQSLVARVYNGSYMGLKRLGIAVKPVTAAQDALKTSTKHATVEQKEHAKQLDATATRTRALGLIQQKFGGQSEAYAKSTAGAFDRAKASLQLVEERVGAIVLPIMAKGATAIANLADTADKHWPEIKAKADEVFKPVKAALEPIVDAIGARLPAAVAKTKSAIAGSVQVVKDIADGFQKGKVWAVALVGALGGLASAIAIVKTVTLAVSVATKAWAIAQGILNAVMEVNPLVAIGTAVAVVAGALVALELKTHFVEKAWRSVKQAFAAVTDWIGGAATNAFGAVKWAAEHGLLGPIPFIISRWGDVKDFFSKLPGRIVGFFKSLPGRMAEIGTQIIGGLVSGIEASAKHALSSIGNLASGLASKAKHALHINSPSKVFHEIGLGVGEGLGNGIKASAAMVRDGVTSGLLFPIDQAIAELNDKKAALQASFDAQDARLQRAALVGGLSRAQGEKVGKGKGAVSAGQKASDVQAAEKALRDFDRAAARSRALARIDVKVTGLTQLNTYTNAIKGIRSQLDGLVSQAGQAWRAAASKALANGPLAQQLAQMQADDKTAQADRDRTQLEHDLATAQAGGDPQAVKDAQTALDDWKRQQTEQSLQDQIDAQNNALDQQQADYEAGLAKQLDSLTDNLEQRKIRYATWASDVNAILATYGLSVATDSSTEAAVSAGPGLPTVAKPTKKASKKPKHRASGGWVYPGEVYQVNEVGQEMFTPRAPGFITPASRAGGGGAATVHIEHFHANGGRQAKQLADRLAFRVRFA